MKKASKEIFEEGEKIYPISDNSARCDQRCSNFCKIENWFETFYHIKESKSKARYIELIKKSEYSKFFEGLNYEYGKNGYPINLKKAFEIYKKSADNSTDSMSMFRLYHIFKNDFKKFYIPKRNRVLEKFYLFKCYAFLRYPIMDRDQYLCNRLDINNEIKIHFEEEDYDFIKFKKLMNFLKKYYKLYDISLNDLELIEAVLDYQLNNDTSLEEKAIKNLKNLASIGNLEALYKLTVFNKSLPSKEKETEQRFNILFNKKYYRSYIDYALYLNKNKRYKEALKILKIARENGMISAGFLYFDIYLDNVEFSQIMNEAVQTSFSNKCELYNLFNILIDDILTESVFSYFEYIYFRKIIIKHYNLEKEFNNYFHDYTKEIVNFLVKITSGEISTNKKMVRKYFCSDDNLKEYYLASGTLYFYGIKNLINIDLQKCYNNFIISYKLSDSDSYQRFCYFYIYKARKKMLEEAKKNSNNNFFINEDIIKKTEKNLFYKYEISINKNTDYLSSSYFYYLSRLYHKKIGNNGDKILEYICQKKSVEYRNTSPGAGSIISYYRKNKSKILFEKYKSDFKNELNNIVLRKDSEGYGEDGTICPICFEFKRKEMALPCKHLFCEFCIGKLDKCAICRKSILMKYWIG